MAYTLGASHTLSGTGSVALASPIGLKYTMTVPTNLGYQSGVPREYWGAGHLTPGNADGYLPAFELKHEAGLFLPLPDSLTVLGYTLAAGVGLVVRELVGVAAASVNFYDRSPTAILRSGGGGIAGGTAATNCWSYTVPTGRKLWVASARASVTRQVAATTAINAQTYVELAGVVVAHAVIQHNTTPFTFQDFGPQAGLVLNAGQTINGWFQNSDAGGTILAMVQLNGVEFAA